jgi:hypothetical protein
MAPNVIEQPSDQEKLELINRINTLETAMNTLQAAMNTLQAENNTLRAQIFQQNNPINESITIIYYLKDIYYKKAFNGRNITLRQFKELANLKRSFR